jgi:carboxyl-terminal processing protease
VARTGAHSFPQGRVPVKPFGPGGVSPTLRHVPLLLHRRPVTGRPRRPAAPLRRLALAVGLGAVLATGAVAGSWSGTALTAARRAAARGTARPAERIGPGQIAADIAAGRVDPRSAAELVSRSGDRWSAFYTAQEYEGFQQSLNGHYTGVGLWVRRRADGRVEISRVQSGGPAAHAALRSGDRLLAIDGTPVTGHPVTEVVARLRGESDGGAPAAAGSRVTLTLSAPGGRSRTVALRRAVLPTQAVTVSHLTGGVLSIRIDAFTSGTGAAVRRALRAGAGRHGVLLDLRGNAGGLVEEAVQVASAFLPGGLVATYDVRGSQRALYATGRADTRAPLVVLVDGGTMSAAELLAGALQDRGRAVLVGQRTFGKGSVQMPSRLPDGSVAELTVGHYRLPTGRDINGHGIEPDLTVPAGLGSARTLDRAREVLGGLGTPAPSH